MQRIIAGLALAALLVAGPAGAELTGGGEWRSLNGEGITGKWTVSLTRTGERVEGELTLSGSNLFTGGKVTGTIDGSRIVLGVMTEGGKVASFAGKLDGAEVQGEWDAAAAQDHGVWFGSLRDTAADK